MKSLMFSVLFVFVFVSGCNVKKTEIGESQKNSFSPKGNWIDLTYSFDEESVYWPTNIPFKHETVFEGINDKGYFYSSYKFSAEEHGGTHFDAPNHFGQNKNSVEKIPVEQFMGEGVVVNVTEAVLKNRDYQITVADLKNWEDKHGLIPEGAIVLLYTGFGKFYTDKVSYTGTSKSGASAVPELHFPGLHPDAAKWLAAERKINAVGLDTPSIDYGQSQDFMTHRILCDKNMTMYENVANLEKLPPKGSWIIALPMKIKGGSGAPLRIIACVSN
jgi:kynurenine formamidase